MTSDDHATDPALRQSTTPQSRQPSTTAQAGAAPSVFRIRSFGIIGLPVTQHGLCLVTTILDAGLRPAFALMAAEVDNDLDRSRSLWSTETWWRDAPSRIGADPLPAHVAGLGHLENVYRTHGVPYAFVPGLAQAEACGMIRRSGVDALLLAAGPILKGPILSAAPQGIINVHPAPLPEFRGNYTTYWTIYHDYPLAVSAHIVDEGVDTGPILMTRPVPVRRGDTLEDLDDVARRECGALAADVLATALGSGLPLRPQPTWQGQTFTGPMPAAIVDQCRQRLQKELYSHYD